MWKRVWQAPLIDSYLAGAPKGSAAAILGLRGMAVMTDKNGVKALYAAAGGFSFALQQPLLMRSTDGVTWTPCYAPPEMGRESRAIFAHHGKLYLGVGPAEIRSSVKPGAWASDDPADPTSWKKVIDFPTLDPTNNNVLSFATLCGRLYAGTSNRYGFQVWRSDVRDPMGNADWTKVVTGGAGSIANEWAGTMKVFNGAVYVGSMHVPGVSGSTELKGFDLIRIWPSGSWQLVIGTPRMAETPAGDADDDAGQRQAVRHRQPAEPVLLEHGGARREALHGHVRPDLDAQVRRCSPRAARSPCSASPRSRSRRCTPEPVPICTAPGTDGRGGRSH